MSDNTTATAPSAPLPAKHSFKSLKECQTLEEAFNSHDFMERIQASVPQHVQPHRMLRTFIQAATKTPLLREARLSSFIGACLTLSQVGLEANTPLGHAYLIPFKTKVFNPATRKRDKEIVEVNVVFGYPGLLDLSFRTSLVKSIHADVVWPSDEFSFEYGSDAHIRHKPLGLPRKDSTQPTHAYMHAALRDGQAFEVMPYSEVLRTRDRSQAYRTALAAKAQAQEKGWAVPRAYTDAPWVAFEVQMARKTVFRQGSKWLPRSVELASSIALDEAQERRKRMDFSAVLDAPTIDGKADYLSAAVNETDEPENQEELPPPRDPGAAHTDRRPVDNKTSQQKPTQTAERQPPPPTSQPDFEAVLIDRWGEISDAYTNPVTYARALVKLCEDDPEGQEAVLEHNADAIEDLRAIPAAWAIAEMLFGNGAAGEAGEAENGAGDTAQDDPPVAFLPIEPIKERGRESWPNWLKAIRDEMAMVPGEHLIAWLDVQRLVLERAPIAQRALAVRHINEQCTRERVPSPAWLPGLIATGSTTTQQSADDNDEKWARRTIDDLKALQGDDGRASLTILAGSVAVRTRLARLQQQNAKLFSEVDAAFAEANTRLPGTKGNGK